MGPLLKTPELLGQSSAIQNIRDQIASAAATDAKVLILGETGVGKEVVAQLVHLQGRRRAQPFIAVNCSGIPETLLESELFGFVRGSFTGAFRDSPGLIRRAHGGTLFLDELGEMSLRMQAVLLRFAEGGEIQPVGSDRSTGCADVRLITATNRNLQTQIAAGAFREDLYYRLNVVEFEIPALRERAGDIPLLLEHFLRQASATHECPCPVVGPGALAVLMRHHWPGNLRQLKNLAERLVVRQFDHSVNPEDLPREFAGAASAPQAAADKLSPSRVDAMWRGLLEGQSFWSLVHAPFMRRDVTREEVRALVDRGLRESLGHYRGMLKIFHVPDSDYRRVMNFLRVHDCQLPFQEYRMRVVSDKAPSPPAREYASAQV